MARTWLVHIHLCLDHVFNRQYQFFLSHMKTNLGLWEKLNFTEWNQSASKGNSHLAHNDTNVLFLVCLQCTETKLHLHKRTQYCIQPETTTASQLQFSFE